MIARYCWLIAIVGLVCVHGVHAQVREFSYQGLATTTAGVPLTGTHTIGIIYYDKLGTPLGSETFAAVTFRNGVFDLALGSMIAGGGFPLSFDFSSGMSLGVSIDGGTEMKSPILGAPYALGGGVLAPGDVTVSNGHLTSKQTIAPTTSVSNAANITASSVLNGTDVAGRVSFTASTSAKPGDYVKVKFNKPYSTAPIVMISPADAATQDYVLGFFATSTASDFNINMRQLIDGTFTFNYMVMETQ